MKIYSNEKLIKRNKKIGQITTIASLIILGGGLYISFQPDPSLVTISLGALLIGFILSQVGIYFGNRWGRNPRPDERIRESLKGLDDRYTLYNYTSPIPHLLLGPNGLWALLPYHQAGTFTYEKNRWKQKKGGVMSFYLRIFAQDSIGRPDLEAESQVDTLKREITKKIGEGQVPPITPVLVFTNEKADVEAENPPVIALEAKKLKEVIRKRAKDNPLSPDRVTALQQALLRGDYQEE